jgi:hypothetical protein
MRELDDAPSPAPFFLFSPPPPPLLDFISPCTLLCRFWKKLDDLKDVLAEAAALPEAPTGVTGFNIKCNIERVGLISSYRGWVLICI